ncbi:MAG: hypothetical protein V3V22_03955 [Methylococcales bacterium]
MALLSCAEQKREATLEDNLTMYEKAIRWSEFSRASKYLRDPENADIDKLEGIKVTSYKPTGRDVSEDEQQIVESVRISYTLTGSQTERTLMDRQIWEYDQEKNRWYLTTNLPDFTAASHRGYGR